MICAVGVVSLLSINESGHVHFNECSGVRGNLVSPSTPWTEGGLYWGYKVRLASSFGAVFTESPYPVSCV